MNGFQAPPRDRAATATARLWRELAQAQDAALEAEERARGAGPLPREAAAFAVAHGLGPARSRRRLGRLPVALGLAAAAAVLVVVVSGAIRRPTLSVQLGTSAPRGEAIPSLVADARSDLPLRFSDGSTVTFRAGSSGQLEKLNSAGAELVLVRGTLQAHVIHAATTSWVLHAGPYRVRVTGTRFGLSWRAERLELSLYEGSVVVDGASLGSGVPVRAGQRLSVSSGVVRIEPLAGSGSTTLALATPGASGGAREERAVSPVIEELRGEGPRPTQAAERPASDAGPALAPPPPHAGVRTRSAGARGARPSRRLASAAGGNAALDDEWLALADRGAYR